LQYFTLPYQIITELYNIKIMLRVISDKYYTTMNCPQMLYTVNDISFTGYCATYISYRTKLAPFESLMPKHITITFRIRGNNAIECFDRSSKAPATLTSPIQYAGRQSQLLVLPIKFVPRMVATLRKLPPCW
jgi:hypothetical protein